MFSLPLFLFSARREDMPLLVLKRSDMLAELPTPQCRRQQTTKRPWYEKPRILFKNQIRSINIVYQICIIHIGKKL